MPFGARTGGEQDHVPNAITLRRYDIALNHDRSFEDHDGLVEIVVPVELALGAGPDQRPVSPACAGRQKARASFRISFNDPRWLDRRELEIIHLAMSRFSKRKHLGLGLDINSHGFKNIPLALVTEFSGTCIIRFPAKLVKMPLCSKPPLAGYYYVLPHVTDYNMQSTS